MSCPNPQDERRFPDFSYIAEKEDGAGIGGDTLTGHLDCVIVSHFHLDHCGALPFMTEMVINCHNLPWQINVGCTNYCNLNSLQFL